jgi:hypothetical protein
MALYEILKNLVASFEKLHFEYVEQYLKRLHLNDAKPFFEIYWDQDQR